MVAAGTFREDLRYRLSVVPIHTPPLRSRREDIALLAHHLLKVVCQRAGRARPAEITTGALQALGKYHWPGNVRELENTLERLTAITEEGAAITAEDVRFANASGHGDYEYLGVFHNDESFFRHFDRQQLKLYYQVLDSVGGNHAKAALLLGVERTALYKHVKRLEKRLSAER
ncbi:MAG: hypothetical protein M3R15_14005 [Acidobacteriota bacterium]|nr:hypothetical protein [Acidobacteriota bacterium]